MLNSLAPGPLAWWDYDGFTTEKKSYCMRRISFVIASRAEIGTPLGIGQ